MFYLHMTEPGEVLDYLEQDWTMIVWTGGGWFCGWSSAGGGTCLGTP